MTHGGDTIFGKIIRREIPAQIVYETENVLAFPDKELLGELMLEAAEIARREGLDKDGYRVVTNIGANAGQTVFHLHLHIIGGRPFQWPPG